MRLYDRYSQGLGSGYTTLFREYDPEIARWKSLDPKLKDFPSESPFSAMGNNPIMNTDVLGDYPDGGESDYQFARRQFSPEAFKGYVDCNNTIAKYSAYGVAGAAAATAIVVSGGVALEAMAVGTPAIESLLAGFGLVESIYQGVKLTTDFTADVTGNKIPDVLPDGLFQAAGKFSDYLFNTGDVFETIGETVDLLTLSAGTIKNKAISETKKAIVLTDNAIKGAEIGKKVVGKFLPADNSKPTSKQPASPKKASKSSQAIWKPTPLWKPIDWTKPLDIFKPQNINTPTN